MCPSDVSVLIFAQSESDKVLSSLSFLFSHRSENSKSEVSIDEEIEEVSIEGPDISDKVFFKNVPLLVLTLLVSEGV